MRPIRSFVRRNGRMTPNQKQAFENLWLIYGVTLPPLEKGAAERQRSGGFLSNKSPRATHDPFPQRSAGQAFQRGCTQFLFEARTESSDSEKKIILEIGFGMGHSLIAMAEQFPEHNFLGVEVHRPGIGAVLNAIHAKQLKNIRVICEDVLSVLSHIPDNTLDAVLIFFPDPWPKKRHHKRRLIQPSFIEQVNQKLKKKGYIHIATDWENYAEHIEQVLNQFPQLVDVTHSLAMPRVVTKFEERGRKLGHTIFEFVREVSPHLADPHVE